MKDKNSAPKSKSKPAILQNTKIRKRTECTALDKLMTIREASNAKIENKRYKKKSVCI